MNYSGDHIFYDIGTSFHHLKESIEHEKFNCFEESKFAYANKSDRLQKLIERSFASSTHSICLVHILKCLLEMEVEDNQIVLWNAWNNEFATSKCFLWELVKHLKLYLVLPKMTIEDMWAPLVDSFLSQFVDHLLYPPITPPDVRALLHLMPISWLARDEHKPEQINISAILLRIFQSRCEHLSPLCQLLQGPQHSSILLTTVLNFLESDTFTQVEDTESSSTKFSPTGIPSDLSIAAASEVRQLFGIIHPLLPAPIGTCEDVSGPRLSASIFLLLDKICNSRVPQCLEQDLSQDPMATVRDRCVLRSLRILTNNYATSHYPGHEQLRRLAVDIRGYLANQYGYVLQTLSPHVDSVIWWLDKGQKVQDLALWFLSCDFPDLHDSDRIVSCLYSHKSELANVEICRSLIQRISRLMEHRIPVDNFRKLLCDLLVLLGDQSKRNLLEEQLRTRLTLMEVGSFQNSLRKLLNQLTEEISEETNTTAVQLFFLFLEDPLAVLKELFRFGVQHKGALQSIISMLESLNFSFSLCSPTSDPLLLQLLTSVLFSSPSYINSLTNNETQRIHTLLSKLLQMPASQALLVHITIILIVPNLDQSSKYLDAALLLVSHIFNSTNQYRTDEHLNDDMLTAIICSLTGLTVSRDLEDVILLLIGRNSQRIRGSFLLDFLKNVNASLRVHVLCLAIYKEQNRYLNLPRDLYHLLDEKSLKKHFLICGAPKTEKESYESRFSSFTNLIHFAGASQASLQVTIETLNRPLEISSDDVAISLLQLLPRAHSKQWSRMVHFLVHLCRLRYLHLPYKPKSETFIFENLDDCRGRLDIVSFLLNLIRIITSAKNSATRQTSTLHLLTSVKLVARPPQKLQHNPVDFMVGREMHRLLSESLHDWQLLGYPEAITLLISQWQILFSEKAL